MGATTMIRSMARCARRRPARASPKVVFPAPGVAVTRKSVGAAASYFSIASACQARSGITSVDKKGTSFSRSAAGRKGSLSTATVSART